MKVCREQHPSFCPGAGPHVSHSLWRMLETAACIFMARTVGEDAQTVALCTRCCMVSHLSSLADVAPAMAAGLDLTLLTDLTGGKVGAASNFRGCWMWGCPHLAVLSAVETVAVGVCVKLFPASWGSDREEEEETEAETELAVKVSNYTETLCTETW